MGASIRAAPQPAMRNGAYAADIERGEKHHGQQNPHMSNRNGSRGVTLFELLFALAIVAALTSLALPTMRAALRAGSVRTATIELLTGLQQARASSITTGTPGVLCLTDGNGNCLTKGGTAAAWSAFLETENRQVPLAARSLPPGVLLKASRPRLSFQPDSLSASTATLTICDSQGLARARVIVISQGGRLRLAPADDKPGELSCSA